MYNLSLRSALVLGRPKATANGARLTTGNPSQPDGTTLGLRPTSNGEFVGIRWKGDGSVNPFAGLIKSQNADTTTPDGVLLMPHSTATMATL